MAWVYRQLIAVFHHFSDMVDVGEIQARVNPLRIKVHGQRHQIHVARTFAIAKQYIDLLHGGIASTLLDAAMTHCLLSKGIEALTAELNVRFHTRRSWWEIQFRSSVD